MTKTTGVKNRRLLITKNSILMLVMLVIIFLAIFAWYYINRSVAANGIIIKAAEAGEVEIAVTENGADTGVFGNYVTSNNNTSFVAGRWSNRATFSGPFSFSTDVTSDGETFIIPAFSSTEDNISAKADARTNGKIVNVNGVPKTGSQVKTNLSTLDEGETPDYVKIPFYLRSRTPSISVRGGAYLAMAAENAASGTAITGANSIRKSAYGNFTSDALVAAMRVSLTGGPVETISGNTATNPSSYEKTFVWLPRPDLFLNIPAGTSEDNWTLQTGVTKTAPLSRIGETFPTGSTFRHNYYAPRKDNNDNVIGVTYVEDPSTDNTYIPSSLAGEDPVTTRQDSNAYKSDVTKTKTLTNGSVPTLGTGKAITTFNDSTPTRIGDYYYFKYYLNVWIEGTDSEARRAMDTGKFSLHIEFGSTSE